MQIRAMLTYLEGARYKLQSALLELDHKARGTHPLAQHVQITRDRTGLQQSILKVPLWLGSGDEMDGLNENYCQADVNANDDDLVGAHFLDTQNERLIKHFDRNFQRSQSHLGCSTSPSTSCIPTRREGNEDHQSPAAVVEIKNVNRDRRSKSPIFDRGIADGGSNQPDSDFGNIYLIYLREFGHLLNF